MVKVATPEIRWHCGPTGLNEAVLSIDFLSINETSDAQNANQKIFATGGADKEIKLWYLEADSMEESGLKFIFSLSGHERSVNCVRFSPNGQYLASASDDATIVVWTRPKMASDNWSWDRIKSNSDITRTLLACGHQGDITDLAWSPDSSFLSSTSVDNSCVIWNVEKGKVEERRKDHSQYVQGVAWDPLNEFLVTEGNDRSCRVYSLTGYDKLSRVQGKKHVKKCTCVHTIKSRDYIKPISEKENEKRSMLNAAVTHNPEVQQSVSLTKRHRMFMDDSFPAFARRPCWTPDGNFFLLPSGVYKRDDSSTPVNTVYVFSRGNLLYPSIHLPGQERGSLGVRCSPVVYKMRNEANDCSNGLFHVQTRSVFAVVTLNAVLIYDTEQWHPICIISGIHYADLTDISWSADGQTLGISSIDGYLSFIHFDEGIFGDPINLKDHQKMMEEKKRVMHLTQRAAKKKLKHDEPSVKSPGAGKRKNELVSPILVAFKKNSEKQVQGACNISKINTLQVRKKRKVVVAPDTTLSNSSETSDPLKIVQPPSNVPPHSTQSINVDNSKM